MLAVAFLMEAPLVTVSTGLEALICCQRSGENAPSEGELRNRQEIEDFLSIQGITKGGTLSLVMSLFDVLGLALPWTATAKILYREILTENPNLAWKQKIA